MSTSTTSPRAPAQRPSGRNSGGPRRSRGVQIAVVAISIGLLVVALLVFFLQSGGKTGPSNKSVSTNVKLTLGGVQNANAGQQATLADDAANQIIAAVGQYVDRGLVVPVKKGQPPKNVAELFDAGTQAAIQGPDKGVLFENGEPKRTGDFKASAEPVLINALSDNGGQFVLATATFNYKANVAVQGGTLSTARTTALTFTPENGQWKITGYDVSVTRQGAQVEGATTTTAVKK
jgi:hypothetical protein